MRPSGSTRGPDPFVAGETQPSDTAGPPVSDMDRLMRDASRDPPPEALPSFRVSIWAAVSIVAIWASIALFWPVGKQTPLRLCGNALQTTSCVVHH